MKWAVSTSPHRRAAGSAALAVGLAIIASALWSVRAAPAHAAATARAAIPALAAGAPPVPTHPAPPQDLFPGLFAAVQESALLPDGKDFADAVPKVPPAQIMSAYRALHPETAEALRSFVLEYFSLPPAVLAPAAAPDTVSIVEHIDRLWDPLTRRTTTASPYSSLLSLPHAYVVPGGRFREIYYWDSYFTMLGLLESGRRSLVEDMVKNFAYLIDTYGHVPNGARTYYISRSQPPFFFAMVGLLSPDDPAAAYARYLPELRREHAFWMNGALGLRHGAARRRVVALADGTLLNRYWDDRDTPRDESYREDTQLARSSGREPRRLYRDIRAAAESGWDFGSRWFADGKTTATLDTTEIVPVDLNSLLYGLERAIGDGCERTRDAACSREFARRATARHAGIDKYLWNTRRGAYLDYRWTRRESVPRLSAATLYPLFVAVAGASQAAAVAQATNHDLLAAGGVVTTPFGTGQQWDAPNGWAPLQWIAVDGLRRYGQAALAATIACRFMTSVEAVYDDTGKLVEKYDVITTGRRGGGGEYPLQDGFGWTNGVMRKLVALYPPPAGHQTVAQCLAAAGNDDPAASKVK